MRQIVLTIFAILAIGCIKESDSDTGYRQRLVVDGAIESGRGAVVSLSLNTPFSDSYDEDDFRDMVVRWAKVTVRHGEESEVLIGRSNSDYPTRFIYTGSDIIGQAGESYDLIVEYSGRVWYASTTIPEPAELGEIRVEMLCDTLCTISATLPPIATPCAVDCALGDSRYYAPTLLGVYDKSSKPRQITISRPLDNLYRTDYMTSFHLRDTVSLRLRTMNEFSYEYWNLWENNVINSVNPIFPAVDNLPTNISDDAIGIWAGYGRSTYPLGVLEDIVEK